MTVRQWQILKTRTLKQGYKNNNKYNSNSEIESFVNACSFPTTVSKMSAGKNVDWADFKQTARSDKYTRKTKQRWAVSGNTQTYITFCRPVSCFSVDFMHQPFSCAIRDLCWHLKCAGFQTASGLGRPVGVFMSHCLCFSARQTLMLQCQLSCWAQHLNTRKL